MKTENAFSKIYCLIIFCILFLYSASNVNAQKKNIQEKKVNDIVRKVVLLFNDAHKKKCSYPAPNKKSIQELQQFLIKSQLPIPYKKPKNYYSRRLLWHLISTSLRILHIKNFRKSQRALNLLITLQFNGLILRPHKIEKNLVRDIVKLITSKHYLVDVKVEVVTPFAHYSLVFSGSLKDKFKTSDGSIRFLLVWSNIITIAQTHPFIDLDYKSEKKTIRPRVVKSSLTYPKARIKITVSSKPKIIKNAKKGFVVWEKLQFSLRGTEFLSKSKEGKISVYDSSMVIVVNSKIFYRRLSSRVQNTIISSDYLFAKRGILHNGFWFDASQHFILRKILKCLNK